MADQTDVLLQLYIEERTQARQSENQRAMLTNIVIVVVGAGLAFISDQDLKTETLALSLGIIVVGCFGAVASAKYFERWYRHWMRAYAYRAQLFDLYPNIETGLAKYSHTSTSQRTDVYEQEAEARFKVSSKLKLYLIWVGLHCVIIAAGIVLTVLVLLHE